MTDALAGDGDEMKRRLHLIALSALFAAGPCAAFAGNGGAGPAARDSARAVALDSAFMVGFWTDSGDCGDALELAGDGRFIVADGGTGRWSLQDDRLTMIGSTTVTVRIVPVDRDSITVVNADGALGHSNRCAARKAGDAPVRGDAS
jgi:hypothetical protein